MRHILIILSILLLLTSPLFGQSKKKGLLYIWENGSRYVGEWKDGKKHGQGTYTSGKGEGEGLVVVVVGYHLINTWEGPLTVVPSEGHIFSYMFATC